MKIKSMSRTDPNKRGGKLYEASRNLTEYNQQLRSRGASGNIPASTSPTVSVPKAGTAPAGTRIQSDYEAAQRANARRNYEYRQTTGQLPSQSGEDQELSHRRDVVRDRQVNYLQNGGTVGSSQNQVFQRSIDAIDAEIAGRQNDRQKEAQTRAKNTADALKYNQKTFEKRAKEAKKQYGEDSDEYRAAQQRADEATKAVWEAGLPWQMRVANYVDAVGGRIVGTAPQLAATLTRPPENEIRGNELSRRYQAMNNWLQSAADYFYDVSAQGNAALKYGLGKVGSTVADVAVTGGEMLSDAAMNMILPGSGMAAMGLRAGASGANEAYHAGATPGQEFMYGAATAGVEMLTEKMFDGMAKVYGVGAADEITEGIVRRLAETNGGRTLARMLINAPGEGIEEVVSDLANPFIKYIYDNGAALQESYGTSEGFKSMMQEAGYDFLVGAILGVGGAAASVTNGEAAAKNARLALQDDFVAQMSTGDGSSFFIEPHSGQTTRFGVEQYGDTWWGYAIDGQGKTYWQNGYKSRSAAERGTAVAASDWIVEQAANPENRANDADVRARDEQRAETAAENPGSTIADDQAVEIQKTLQDSGAKNSSLAQAVKLSGIVDKILNGDTSLSNNAIRDLDLYHNKGLLSIVEQKTGEKIDTSSNKRIVADVRAIVERRAELYAIEDEQKTAQATAATQSMPQTASETENPAQEDVFTEDVQALPGEAENAVEASTAAETSEDAGSAEPTITLRNGRTVNRQQFIEDIVQARNSAERTVASDAFDKLYAESGAAETQQQATAQQTAAPAQAQQQAEGSSTTRRTAQKPGLIRDEYTKSQDQRQMNVIDLVAKRLGVTVRFVDRVNGGAANAQYADGVVEIEKYNRNPVLFLFGHEITHHLQEIAPESYRAFRDAAMMDIPNADEIIQKKIQLYADRGVRLGRRSAMDELAADYAGQMVDNTSVLERFIERHKENRSLLQRLADAFRSLIDRVGGRYRVNSKNAVNLLEKALRDGANAMEKAERRGAREQKRAQKQANRAQAKENTATKGGDGQYAIKETADGKKYVRADRQVIFGNDPEKWGEQLEDYINGKIRRGQDVVLIGADGDELRLTATSAGKLSDNHTSDGRTMSDAAYERKANAASHIDELVQVSERKGKQKQDEDGRHGAMASGGWAYRTAFFEDFDGTYYKITISAAINDAGNMIYNIGQMKEEAHPKIKGSRASYGDGPRGFASSGNSVRGSDKNVNTKFSLKEPVERTKDLIAVHNKDWAFIRDAALNWGGIPSPSVAIVDAAEGHTKYGDTSVVFPRATIDPEADPRNKVYGGDAWTPTHQNAQVEREVNYNIRRAFEQKVQELGKDVAGGMFSQSSVLGVSGIEDVTGFTLPEIAEKLGRNDAVKAAYLASIGRDVKVVYKTKEYDRFGNAALDRYLAKVDPQELARLYVKLATGEKLTAEEMKPAEDAIRENYEEKHAGILNRRPEGKAKKIAYYMENNVFPNRVEDFIRHAQELYNEGGGDEIDRMATRESLQKAADNQTVAAWAEEQLQGLLGEPGIYNGEDVVTDSGRRSFSETHWDYTAENIVKAMNMAANKGANMYGVSPETLAATATPEYRNVDEMHADEGRLRTVSEEEHAKALQDLGIYLDRVVDDLMRTTKHQFDNSFEEEQNLSGIIAEAAKGKKTVAAVKAAFRKEGYTISDGHAKNILSLIDHAANIPTSYYEAKAQRVVPFSEAAAIIAPTSAPAEEVAAVKAATGVNIIQYETGNEEQRKRLANGLVGVKFSLKEDSDGRSLTKAQQAYFKDSKVRDKDGNLKVMYRGGNEDFTVFDRKKSSYANLYGRGFYFTDSESHARQYGNAKAFYLNITNPVSTSERTITRTQMRKFLKAVAENEDDFSFENYGYGATVDSVLRSVYGKTDFAMLYDVNQTAIGDMVAAVELFNEVNGTNYDGLILDTETVAFRSNQIKSVTNQNPTDNPDIRYHIGGVDTESPDAIESAVQRALALRDSDATPSEIFNQTGLVSLPDGRLRDGMTGNIVWEADDERRRKEGQDGSGGAVQRGKTSGGASETRSVGAAKQSQTRAQTRDRGVDQRQNRQDHSAGKAGTRNWKQLKNAEKAAFRSAVEEYLEETGADVADTLDLVWGNGGGDVDIAIDAFAQDLYSRIGESDLVLENELIAPLGRGNATSLIRKFRSIADEQKSGNVRYSLPSEKRTPSKPRTAYSFAKEVTADYASDFDKHTVAKSVRDIGVLLKDGDERTAAERAHSMAQAVVSTAAVVVNDEEVATRRSIRDYLKGAKLRISDELARGVDGIEALRNGPLAFMTSRTSGLPVDVAYMEMQASFGTHLFPEDVVNPADQLQRIADVLDQLQPKYENPFGRTQQEQEQAAMELAERILDTAEQLPRADLRKADTFVSMTETREFQEFKRQYDETYGEGATDAAIRSVKAYERAMQREAARRKAMRERPDAAETRAENARILAKTRSEHVEARKKASLSRLFESKEKARLRQENRELISWGANYVQQAEAAAERAEQRRVRQLSQQAEHAELMKRRAVLRVKFRDNKTLMSAKIRDGQKLANQKRKTQQAVEDARQARKEARILARRSAQDSMAVINSSRRNTEQALEPAPIDTLRSIVPEQKKTWAERKHDLIEGVKDTGRKLYTAFVSDTLALEKLSALQVDAGAEGLTSYEGAKIAKACNSTIEMTYHDGLYDTEGNRIAEPLKEVAVVWKTENGKKVVDYEGQAVFQDYRLHLHNIDRMSLRERALQKVADFEAANPWLREAPTRELALIAEGAYTDHGKRKDPRQQIVKDYVKLLKKAREAVNKPVFADTAGNPVTADASQRIVEKYEREYPDIVEQSRRLDEWWDTFMRTYVVGVTMSLEDYEAMREIYPHYTPTYRVNQGQRGRGVYAGGGTVSTGSFVKAATGSLKEVRYIEDSYADLVARAIRQNRFNALCANIVETAMNDDSGTFAGFMLFDWETQKNTLDKLGWLTDRDGLDGSEKHEPPALEKDGGACRVSCWINGERVSAYISEDLYNSLAAVAGNKSNSRVEKAVDVFTGIGNKVTSPMKTFITGINPLFGIRNFIRDVPTAVVNSHAGARMLKYIPKAITMSKNNSTEWQAYCALGGTSQSYYRNENGRKQGNAIANWDTRSEMTPWGKVKRGAKKAADTIGWFNELTENAVRFAEYLCAIDNLPGGDTYENRVRGIYYAGEVSVDFSRRGTLGRTVNAWIPYWNPATQGIDKVFRSCLRDVTRKHKGFQQLSVTVARAVLTTAMPEALAMVCRMIAGREDEWEQLSDYVKDNFYCFPIPGKNNQYKFLKVPKNREWAALISNPLWRIVAGIKGREDPFANYWDDSIKANFIPPFAWEAIGIDQYLSIKHNEDFAGRPIVGNQFKDYTSGEYASKKLQYDGDTWAIAKLVSDAMANKLSPVQWEYIIHSYCGDLGDLLFGLVDMDTWNAITGNAPEDYDGWHDLYELVTAGPKKFVADARYSNAATSKYYETMDELGSKVADAKILDPDGYKDSTDYQVRSAIQGSYTKQIQDLNKQIREMADGPEKDALKLEVAATAQEALDFYNAAQNGEITQPKQYMAYEKTGVNATVRDALLALDGLSEDYKFDPSEFSAKKTISAHSGKEWQLDESQQQQWRDFFADEYNERAEALIGSARYINATDARKAAMLEGVYEEATKAAKDAVVKWMKEQGYSPVKKEK